MRASFLYKGVLVAAMLCVVPAALPASPKGGQPHGRTVTADAGISPSETSSLLGQIRNEAVSLKNSADHLQVLAREGTLVGWEGDALTLGDMCDHVNKMNTLVSYLRIHQAEASPLQQEIVNRVAPAALELAGTTQAAIDAVRNNEAAIYMSDLAGLANAMYEEASRVDQTVGDLHKYVHARQEAQQLGQTLGL